MDYFTPQMMIEAKLLTSNSNEESFSTLVESEFLFNFNFNCRTCKVTQNLTLTLNLMLKLKFNPKSDHINVVKTSCFGLGNGFVTFLDNKREVKGTYSAFRFCFF